MISLNEALLNTSFEKELCIAAFDNLKVVNKLRFNNFAYSIRELSRHILYRLAPDKDIKLCTWYKPSKNKNGDIVISRADRINYAIHGGFDNNVLAAMGLKSSIEQARKTMLDSIDALNKYTHVNENTFDVPESEVETLVDKVIGSFNGFVDVMTNIRRKVISHLENEINHEILITTLYETYSEIDILSTHSSIENYYIDSILVDDITSQDVSFTINGTVDVRLQYGSDGDQRRDDGYVTNMSFPFRADVSAEIKTSLKRFHLDGDIHFEVDTDEYYE